MEKFSSINSNKNNDPFVWKGDHFGIKSVEGFNVIVGSNCVIGFVHLLDQDEILLRKEYIPAFKLTDSKDYFLTALSGTIEENEKPEQTLIRELKEEAGIKLNTNYKGYKIWNELFFVKNSSSKAYIYYVPLHNDDFKKEIATTDGSVLEQKSTTVRIDIKHLKSLKPSDIITSLCLQYFNEELAKNK